MTSEHIVLMMTNPREEHPIWMNINCVYPVQSFSRELYVYESEGCSSMAAFRLGSAGLGNREPRGGLTRQKLCQLCSGTLDESHIAFSCMALEAYRKRETGITFFRNMCRTKDVFEKQAYKRYVNGYDWDGDKVSRSDYAKRGVDLKGLRKFWLSLTGYLAYCIASYSHNNS